MDSPKSLQENTACLNSYTITKLAANVHLLEPLHKHTYNNDKHIYNNEKHTKDSTHPDLVILCTWMSAAPRHIKKYILGHQTLHPNSTILIITTSVFDILLVPLALQRKRLGSCLSYIETSASAKVVLHLFSGGGAHTASLLAEEYSTTYGVPLPLHTMILDSSPGTNAYAPAFTACISALPTSPLLRIFLTPLIHCLVGVAWVLEHKFGVQSVVTKANARLNDGKLVQKGKKRLYVYSEADGMVLWRGVEVHANEAEEKGWRVQRMRVRDAGHVAIMGVDPVAYWGAVGEACG
ncbi:hypothetical protein AUEXF2481DRAFT_40684 [Aureobasidium subglaciale EXF-2481]|uniref:Indole-diterpene biosynthesis protein PaxU n=1 Tax=Aureobasidium subglaciale (strain EXF-2481) TaxID=1043005 RepID=A0A074YKW6_AURSE|nr:uncharacterized protein AUEXF2481DRAFT_40684 [Aureobasidium subglaciale EXF-2481]KEQ94737.1 hypothetical protein AUEXF2481DRAFT_40684 [Aureobasidium subglaciale EXF-2481]